MSRKFNGSSYTDESLIAGIRKGGLHREKCILWLYDRYAGYVYKGINIFQLDMEDAKDAYSDAILATVLQIQRKQFRKEGKVSTYLYQSFMNRCKNQIRSARVREREFLNKIPNLPDNTRSMLEELIDQEEIFRYKELFGQLGEKCQQILWDSLFHGYTMEEICARIGYTSAASVSNMKYKCMDRLKRLLKRNQLQPKETL